MHRVPFLAPTTTITMTTLLALAVLASACAGDDLRTRMKAAGVFSPSRSDGGRRGLADLGQLLFFDKELSGNRNIACASCHMPIHHAGDQIALGRGQGAVGLGPDRTGGTLLPRNTPSPFNRSFAESLFWDGRVELLPDGTLRAPVALPDGIDTLLEAQALLPLVDRDEMRGRAGDTDALGGVNELALIADDAPEEVWAGVMARLMANERYRELFASAFPDTPIGEHTIVHVARAIARFEMRLWELTDTRFDQFLGSEHRKPNDQALNDEERRGAELFFGDGGCDRCHSGPLLSDFAFHDLGVVPFGPGKRDGLDEGRFLVTNDPADRFAFRTPPLRNVEMTGPYMHDGVATSLEDAIALHLEPGRSLDDGRIPVDPALADEIRRGIDPDTAPLRELASEEIDDLVAFLRSLSSTSELTIFPGAGEPFEVPSGLPVDHADF